MSQQELLRQIVPTLVDLKVESLWQRRLAEATPL
jgi:hypothetical protein